MNGTQVGILLGYIGTASEIEGGPMWCGMEHEQDLPQSASAITQPHLYLLIPFSYYLFEMTASGNL